MTALITLSHGSRHADAQRGIERLTAAAARLAGVQGFSAHLDFTAPDLTQAVADARWAGHTRAVVVPLLFTRAFHATHDVPAALASASGNGVELTLADGLGQGGDIARVLAARLHADGPDCDQAILYPVGTSHAAAAHATRELGQHVAELTGVPVTVVPATGRGPLIGTSGITEVARMCCRTHLLPLFVTTGLLLERALAALPEGCTTSAPLETDLAAIVAARFRSAALIKETDPCFA
ncbi:sirohydrochlorin chelatase [Corynebacterium sp.]|uniref:sirohydrochlorin chelatase n=1 Tax=Corynebacterium sp. TaxID=1720 RepID=UPI002A919731|nr:CbiX/SirB N-terminal domain-containing protein [Corynebacterium sp.]MDY5785650.1 CbiX/SirB N-terminal domain-containing protein [Corynebacterium sp.]